MDRNVSQGNTFLFSHWPLFVGNFYFEQIAGGCQLAVVSVVEQSVLEQECEGFLLESPSNPSSAGAS